MGSRKTRKKLRFLFLDIDGVLNSHQSFHYASSKYKRGSKIQRALCPVGMSNLRYLVHRYKLKIVVSSTHRKSLSISKLSKWLGLPIYDRTPVMHVIRGKEIAYWLSKNRDVSDFIILDDDSDMGRYLGTGHFIHCDSRIGLSWLEVEKAIIHLDRFTLSFKDVKKGQYYHLFSKPHGVPYYFDGKNFLCDRTKTFPGNACFLYKKTEKFARVKRVG
jgi:hypothetical protein